MIAGTGSEFVRDPGHLGGLIAAIAAVSIAGAGLSLSIPLIAVRMEQAGYSGEANGAAIAVAGLSTLVFAPFVPALARRVGMKSFLLASLAVGIISLLGFAATAWDLRLWWPLRGIFSCALTGLFVSSEFAVNALAPAERRGMWIGIYSTSLALGFAIGPVILGLAGNAGSLPFLAGAALFMIASLPVLLKGDRLPLVSRGAARRPLGFVLQAPGLMSAAFVFGAIETGAMGLLPVHALRNGFTAENGALFVAALAIGNMLCQIPLGLVSDRIPRVVLLLVVSACATFGALALAFLSQSAVFVPLLVVWSGLASGLYMVGLAELGGRYRDGDLAAANAAFVACYASGMIAGPPLVGRALDAFPAEGLFLSLALLAAMTLTVQLLQRVRTAR